MASEKEEKKEEIFQAPKIVRDLSSKQLKLGTRLSLRVVATGRPMPSYQWYFNGKKISGANTDRLSIPKARHSHTGNYSCEVFNVAGRVTSRSAMVSFLSQSISSLVIAPGSSMVVEGKPFRLKVINPENPHGLNLQWMLNGKRITGATGPALAFSAVEAKYEGEYKAILTLGSEILVSNIAKLQIKKAARKEPAPQPKVAAGPVAPVRAEEQKAKPPAPAEANTLEHKRDRLQKFLGLWVERKSDKKAA